MAQARIKSEEEDQVEQEMSESSSSPPLREYPEAFAKYQIKEEDLWPGNSTSASSAVASTVSSSSSSSGSKRPHTDEFITSGVTPRRKTSSCDFLRKGQWTRVEERLARLLIEAFEEGYLPIYTGIRLRGYLAVQLQCDPMRVSKKLCAGSIDGKVIPRNYGQKKFKLRKKQLWDRVEAGRIIDTLERLTLVLWRETGVSPPPYLTLSSTRNEDDYALPPVKNMSPSKSKRHQPNSNVVFPIIYLNLSKRMKNAHSSTRSSTTSSDVSDSDRSGTDSGCSSDTSETILTARVEPIGSSSKSRAKHSLLRPRKHSGAMPRTEKCTDDDVDVESINAAKELVRIFHHEYSSSELTDACEIFGSHCIRKSK